MLQRIIYACICKMLLMTATNAAAEDQSYYLDAHGRPLVAASLGTGAEARLLLDTAARRTGLTNGLAAQAGAVARNRSRIHHFSSQGILSLPLAKLDKMTIFGKQVIRNTIALYPDNAPLQGIVGFDTLRGQVFRIEPENRIVHIAPHAGDIADAGWSMIEGRSNRYMGIVLTAQYQGEEIDVLLATGSSHTVLDRRVAKKLFPKKDFSVFFGITEVYQGLAPKALNLDIITLENFAIGPWHLGDLDVAVARLPVKQTIGVAKANLLMLGADVLMQQPLAFDFRNQSLWVPVEGTR